MKEIKMMLTIAVGAIALGAGGFFGYDAYQEATMTAEERLFQANLEALTNNENNEVSSWSIPPACYPYTNFLMPCYSDDIKDRETGVLIRSVIYYGLKLSDGIRRSEIDDIIWPAEL